MAYDRNPFTIGYIVRRSPIELGRVGTLQTLVAEARTFSPPDDHYDREDGHYDGGFESALLEQWEEVDVEVIEIEPGYHLLGATPNLPDVRLSRILEWKEFVQSAADGQLLPVNAGTIGGVDRAFNAKLISPRMSYPRKGQKMRFSVQFRLRLVEA